MHEKPRASTRPDSDWLAPLLFFPCWQARDGAPPVITAASASFAQLGKQEIPTASIATTSPGAAGAGEAPGTAPRIMLVCVTPASYRENAASIRGPSRPLARQRSDSSHVTPSSPADN